MISAVSSPMDLPLFLAEITSVEKSWTAPMKILPRKTHRNAGSQPQIIPMAGPTIGPSPAMVVKW
jgi:hypothetical protein